uniref:Uncharacterized protein n=1 Tax=Heliothis virescens TaxID=7102 RepID=A0A2A4JBF1_HELVI
MDIFENVTQRKKRTGRSLSVENINTLKNCSLDGSTSSLPYLSDYDDDLQLQEYKKEIDSLKQELAVAHEEINNLSLENTSLKNKIMDLNKKQDLITKATKKLTIQNSTPTKTPKTKSKKSNNHTTTVIEARQNSSIQQSNDISIIDPTVSPENNVHHDTTLTEKNTKKHEHRPQLKNKPKMCILSNNKTNNILSLAEDTFTNYEVCHYLSINCGLKQLINNLHIKLTNYTLEDYCIIMIGPQDFQKTNNYVDLILHLRETLLPIQHTNVIVCVPTYKITDFNGMFNWRVESFCNLLYLDSLTHNYATFLDSNLNLKYDFTMFSKFKGTVNNFGMKTIFDDLKYYIKEPPQCSANKYENYGHVNTKVDDECYDNNYIHDKFFRY